jgi:bifunctional NMN adenylyltransferase/nudix hydrolase
VNTEHDLAVFIGRFQPFHLAHLEIVKKALEIADHLLVIIGSRSSNRRTVRNPWNRVEREDMLIRGIEQPGLESDRVYIESVYDVPEDNECWFEQVHDVIDRVVYHDLGGISRHGPDPKVTLTGFSKDSSSFYLQTFPGLVYSPVDVPDDLLNLSATDIRKKIISGDNSWMRDVPSGVRSFIEDWLRTHDLPKEG